MTSGPTFTPIDATLGAVVTDVDLNDVDDDTWADIHGGFLRYGVLVFPRQHLSKEAQGVFAHRFGDRMEGRATGRISNQRRDGSVTTAKDEAFRLQRGNEGWHIDSTYMPLAAKAGMLSALKVPPAGGETEFADMRAAWQALDDATRTKLEGLSAHHSLYRSQAKIGFVHKTDHLYGFHTKGTPLRPMMKQHPETGRKAIYAGRHAYGIPGMGEEESERFLAELMDFACQPPRIYSHRWQVGDLVVWDNRCIMHRAAPYDTNHPRVLQSSRVSGDPETEMAPTFADPLAEEFAPDAEEAAA